MAWDVLKELRELSMEVVSVATEELGDDAGWSQGKNVSFILYQYAHDPYTFRAAPSYARKMKHSRPIKMYNCCVYLMDTSYAYSMS